MCLYIILEGRKQDEINLFLPDESNPHILYIYRIQLLLSYGDNNSILEDSGDDGIFPRDENG